MPKKNEKRITLDWFKENCVPETHLHPGCDRCVFGSGNEADNDHDSCQLWASLDYVRPGPNIRAAMKRHGIKPDTEQGDSPSFAILTGKRIAPDPDPDDFVAEEVGMKRSKPEVQTCEPRAELGKIVMDFGDYTEELDAEGMPVEEIQAWIKEKQIEDLKLRMKGASCEIVSRTPNTWTDEMKKEAEQAAENLDFRKAADSSIEEIASEIKRVIEIETPDDKDVYKDEKEGGE